MADHKGKIKPRTSTAQEKNFYLKIEVQTDVFVDEEKHDDGSQQMLEESAVGYSSSSNSSQHQNEDAAEFDRSVVLFLDRKFTCELCCTGFHRPSSLSVHMSVFHGETSLTPAEDQRTDLGGAAKMLGGTTHPRNGQDPTVGPGQTGQTRARRDTSVNSGRENGGNAPQTCGPRPSSSPHDGLIHHLTVHTEDKPYTCRDCGKAFKRLKNLNDHLTVHTEDKPYKCRDCGKAFKRLKYLKNHLTVHTEDKPYKCRDCGKAFKWLQALKSHQTVHTEDKPYKCLNCGKVFKRLTYLKSHLKGSAHLRQMRQAS